ncbi:hypothetical protein, partial [Dactylosporangium salmoneum]|uniref:hypothetical protein n=1 Tax=Dactylosporangium salmoneum TaxID=53361 RepID=UPI0031D41195
MAALTGAAVVAANGVQVTAATAAPALPHRSVQRPWVSGQDVPTTRPAPADTTAAVTGAPVVHWPAAGTAQVALSGAALATRASGSASAAGGPVWAAGLPVGVAPGAGVGPQSRLGGEGAGATTA